MERLENGGLYAQAEPFRLKRGEYAAMVAKAQACGVRPRASRIRSHPIGGLVRESNQASPREGAGLFSARLTAFETIMLQQLRDRAHRP
jgi:hypothetical protein